METTGIESKVEERIDRRGALLLSAACHLLALILLALLTQAGDEEGPLTLEVGIADAFDLDTPAEFDTVELAKSLDVPLAETPPQSPELAPLALAEALLGAEDFNLGALAPAGLTEGGGGGDEAVSFFGLSGSGESFVFVIDCSSSMNEAGKFTQAKKELMRTLRGLLPHQRYLVVLFSDNAYPMDPMRPIAATPENIDQTSQWLYGLEPDGGTNPLPALLFALELKPSAIFFLSDGKFELYVVKQIKTKNDRGRRQTPIHAVSFYNRQTEGLMKRVARNSGGSYQFVTNGDRRN
ncbi:hypothetical protein Mal64_12600 [Pseudobythopirellula maris]|uniref:VWFA domain-containing protein n=1 Tax=Pseudobythopirellula maris TaxID=2527991 RepID=A0A5C5ZTL6_9BACT|nr:VWA domain-containing protein [Pseudobythopirellula maris]TWT90862.1 hypothetical protein Mal64_12600 [Pseudobythopirellula maris]